MGGEGEAGNSDWTAGRLVGFLTGRPCFFPPRNLFYPQCDVHTGPDSPAPPPASATHRPETTPPWFAIRSRDFPARHGEPKSTVRSLNTDQAVGVHATLIQSTWHPVSLLLQTHPGARASSQKVIAPQHAGPSRLPAGAGLYGLHFSPPVNAGDCHYITARIRWGSTS